MTASVPPDEHAETPPANQRAPHSGQSAALQTLAMLARALANLPPEADDATLIQALGQALVPGCGDFCLLHTADSTGELHLVGVVPSATAEAERLIGALDQQAASMIVYEPLVDDHQPVYASAAGHGDSLPDAEALPASPEHLALLDAAGLAWELVVPLHAGEGTDALLVIDGAAGQPAPAPTEAAQLAAVVAALVSTWRSNRDLRRRTDLLRDNLDAAAHAGRDLAHTLNNSLTMPVGVVELLLDRSTLSAELQEMVQAASSDLASLERHIREFQNQMRTYSSGRMHAGSLLPPP
jgi:hypothetical protein